MDPGDGYPDFHLLSRDYHQVLAHAQMKFAAKWGTQQVLLES